MADVLMVFPVQMLSSVLSPVSRWLFGVNFAPVEAQPSIRVFPCDNAVGIEFPQWVFSRGRRHPGALVVYGVVALGSMRPLSGRHWLDLGGHGRSEGKGVTPGANPTRFWSNPGVTVHDFNRPRRSLQAAIVNGSGRSHFAFTQRMSGPGERVNDRRIADG
ncbi:hypothetical protein [Streptomyces sp. NPDC101150]|uniref:hypothetical protein n=1 Tax=Streptomyces sp. NPDC101150 TaxID=3366114 RepID=UPI00381AB700